MAKRVIKQDVSKAIQSANTDEVLYTVPEDNRFISMGKMVTGTGTVTFKEQLPGSSVKSVFAVLQGKGEAIAYENTKEMFEPGTIIYVNGTHAGDSVSISNMEIGTNTAVPVPAPDAPLNYLCFESLEDENEIGFGLFGGQNEDAPEVSLEYSFDKLNWNAYTLDTPLPLDTGDKVYFRGDNDCSFSDGPVFNPNVSLQYCYGFTMTKRMAASGNIMSIVDSTCRSTTLRHSQMFAFMFSECPITTAPELPATTLSAYCYGDMFYKCAELTTAPELPATNLATGCYDYMFELCTSLATAPSRLPATQLVDECYYGMFYGCSSLTTAPVLPATTLASSCYAYMFEECSSLNSVEVSFTSWDDFDSYDCATESWLYNVAETGTFYCPSLLDIAGLEYRYDDNVPSGWNVVNNVLIQDQTFVFTHELGASNHSLVVSNAGHQYSVRIANGQLPSGVTFNASTGVFSYDGSSVSQETSTSLKIEVYGNDFTTVSAIITIKKRAVVPYLSFTAQEANSTLLLDNNFGEEPEFVTSFEYSTDRTTWNEYTFGTVITLSSVGDSVYFRGNNVALGNYYASSYGTGGMNHYFEMTGTISAGGEVTSLLDKTCTNPNILSEATFANLFKNCTSLTTAPALPAIELAVGCYAGMFEGCTSLATAPELPATTLAEGCYDSMFENCISLTVAPVLPATRLVDCCYWNMFAGCESLNEINISFTTWLYSGSTEWGTYGWVDNVFYTGMFVCPPELNTTETSTSLVPPGWNVVHGPTIVNQGCAFTYELGARTYQLTAYKGGKQCSFRITNGTLPSGVTLNTSTGVLSYNGAMVSQDSTTNVTVEMYGDDFESTSAVITINMNVNINYLTLTAQDANSTVKLVRLNEHQEIDNATGEEYPSFEYSTDRMIWNDYVLGTTITLSSVNDKVYFRGDNDSLATVSEGTVMSSHNFIMTGRIAASGEVTSLIDSTCTSRMVPNGAFAQLFLDCTSLTSAPALPALKLGNYCYLLMFEHCTSLTTAPELPATTLATGCYEAMFLACHLIVNPPTLSATTLAESCYEGMFAQCTSLASAPALPAQKGYYRCYDDMFSGCTSLLSAGDIALTEISGSEACARMFHNCTSLTSAPTALRTAYLPSYTYSYMFEGCTSLTTAPTISAGYSNGHSFEYMFNNCTSLTTAPTFTASRLLAYEYEFQYMFFGCSNLVNPPSLSMVEHSTTSPKYIFHRMFENCTKLASTPTLSSKLTTPGQFGCASMFRACTSLTTVSPLPFTYMRSSSCAYMFAGCTSLTTAPTLSATTLYASCYSHMFAGCTALTSVSTLPATTMANNCYEYMFQGCTSLTTAPTISATALANNCFQYMFSGCTALTSAPSLPVKTLKEYCYEHMFSGCTSLVNPPSLPATTLANYCYQYMFQNCTHLTSAPTLSATAMKQNCYLGMFQNCTALTTMPTLSSTSMNPSCYSRMFEGCTHLTTVSNLPATSLKNYCYEYMFKGCTALTTAPSISATTLANGCCQYMFQNCSNLVSGPSSLPATTLTQNCYQYMFQNCSKLENAPTISGTTASNTNCCGYMFQNCTSLVTAPTLSIASPSTNCYQYMFQGCTSLTTVPTLTATTLGEGCYLGMFKGCTALVNAPDISAGTINRSSCKEMFMNCTNLVNGPSALSCTNLFKWCYQSMFEGCSKLENAPTISATSISESSMQSMFKNCTSLVTAPAIVGTTFGTNTNCLKDMFYGCNNLNSVTVSFTTWKNTNNNDVTTNWLAGVASSGTFTCPSGLDTTTRNASRVPANWTVVNV